MHEHTRVLPPRWTLRREIPVVLAVKTLLMSALWLAFFRNPDGPPAPEQVGSALLGSGPAQAAVKARAEGGPP